MPRIAPQKIDGLQFAIDRKTITDVVTVDGKNFLVDLDGPKSAFATRRSARITDFNMLPESITVGLEVFHFLKNPATNEYGIFKFNYAERQWEIIISGAMTPAYITYKTTHALVGGKQYFANRGWGIWERDPLTNIWTDVTANFPTNVFYITESSGRCIAVADGIVAWSAIDNANDFVPSTVTGAGFQSLSLVGSPERDFDYRGLQKVSDGFLVFMRQGIMKSTAIESLIQFRHRVVKDKLIALNGWSFARINDDADDDALLFLTTRGLYITNGQEFKLWEPLLSEELRLKVIPSLLAEVNGQIQIHYSKEKDWLFVSVTTDTVSKIFEKAFVNYLPRGQWGVFNELHRGFFDIDILGDGSGLQQEQLGYMAVDSEVALFSNNTNHVEVASLGDTSASDIRNEVFYSDRLYDIPNFETNTVLFANSNMRTTAQEFIHDNLAAEHNPVPAPVAYYEINGLQETVTTTTILPPAFKPYDAINNIANAQLTQTKTEVLLYGFTKQEQKLRTLDCNITIGLIRLTDELESDQFTNITNVAVSMTDINAVGSVFEDWLNDFNPDLVVDWLNDFTPDVFEDYGANTAAASNYSASIFGSLDGYTNFNTNAILLDLAKTEGRTRFYSTNTQGIYVLIKLTANQIDDYIHLHRMELTGILSGRL